MATKRITVSVPVGIASRIKRAAGRSRSVSEWVTSAVTRALEEEDVQRRFLDHCDAVPASATEEERARASFQKITGAAAAERGESGRGESAA